MFQIIYPFEDLKGPIVHVADELVAGGDLTLLDGTQAYITHLRGGYMKLNAGGSATIKIGPSGTEVQVGPIHGPPPVGSVIIPIPPLDVPALEVLLVTGAASCAGEIWLIGFNDPPQ